MSTPPKNVTPKRLFKITKDNQIKNTKEATIKGIGLLSRTATLDQGVRLLRNILPTLTSDTITIFLPLLLRRQDNAQPKATRQSIQILGECVQVQPEISTPYARKIIHHVLSHLQNPEGSVEKMHQQCAITLCEIASSIPPG